jgi:CDI immunity proteins
MSRPRNRPNEPTLVDLMADERDTPRLGQDVPRQLESLLRRRPSELTPKELAQVTARGLCLPVLVQRLLEIVEADPLASAGWFAGDLLRSLTGVPEWFWRRHAALYERYREALRGGAAARRALPPDQRLEFWSSIPDIDS